MKKKKILITAGGTATAWHLCNVIHTFYEDFFEIHICDINEPCFVASSLLADFFHKVPSIYEKNYEEAMYKLLECEKIDIIIPLIDFDLVTFAKDNPKLVELGVQSTAPILSTVEILSDKQKMYEFLTKNNIATPHIYKLEELQDDESYVVKPKTGFGSRGVKILNGSEVKNNIVDGDIIQEKCIDMEITAEVYNAEDLYIFQRIRKETKSGVCTKMIPIKEQEIENSIKKLVGIIPCPKAFCLQFMKNKQGHWCLTDCNLRLGAGTALSTKIGFQLVRAFLAELLSRPVLPEWFEIDPTIKTVLRVYKEVILR